MNKYETHKIKFALFLNKNESYSSEITLHTADTTVLEKQTPLEYACQSTHAHNEKKIWV